MSYLLSISIGPVQPFIEAARRTADLTAGSKLLAEIASAVAGCVKAHPGSELIFPADLSKDGPNKILATVSDNPEGVAQEARLAALAELENAWASALQVIGTSHVNLELAQAQIESFLEFYAAWVPLGNDYPDARKQVELLLAGRKALRDFDQPTSESGIPKSPLDPARDSVLLKDIPRGKPPLYLKEAEHLDAVSLIKRVRGRSKKGVLSTTELAARALMGDLRKRAPAETQALEDFARTLPSGVTAEDLLYPGRRADAADAGEITKEEAKEGECVAQAALKRAGYGIAPPDWASYYAILVADGDRMGKLLGMMADESAHMDFSRKLSDFAKKAKGAEQVTGIVAAHGGHCVYSGGDDVLALLPTHTALECARELSSAFRTAVDGTLSVGVAIVHHMEPLRIGLERAREAEREAKKERDSLAVALHTRGGEPRIVAETWQKVGDLTTWGEFIAAFRDKEGLSHGFPYELRHLAREARGVLGSETLQAEACRILERKRGGKDDKPAGLMAAIEECRTADQLEALVAKLVICRFLAQYPEVN